MPSNAYLHVRDGLAVIVSSRAASQVLNVVLGQRGLTPESVDASAMKDLLMGPVLQGLERILPKNGLKEQLQRLVTALGELEADAPPLPEHDFSSRPSTGVTVATSPLGLEKLEAMTLGLAQLEDVRFIAAFRGNKVLLSRGAGYDVSALARLGLTAMKLLGRGGEPRSYYLAHPEGQLFILSLAQDTIMMIGGPKLSLGLVRSTVSALKEEL